MITKLYEAFLNSTGISTDTRNVSEGNLFFALKGPTFNGNQFAERALSAGAKFAVIDEAQFKKDDRYFLVEDVLSTLQALAKFHREKLNIPIIAITGSNGKTTTKELANAVLSTKFNTFATFGNLNNHIGVPLSLLSINAKHEIAIIEMGANHQGEIAAYCQWALPNFGLINNIGEAHLEGFGGIEGVIKGKTELYTSLKNAKGTVFFNVDDALLTEKSSGIENKVSYGLNPNATHTFKVLQETPFVSVQMGETEIKSNLTGSYNIPNIMVACAIGKHFGLTEVQIKEGIEGYFPANNRSQILEKNGVKYIMDAYNANPTSMEAALQSFSKLQTIHKIVILGDMFEVGETTHIAHQKILQTVEKLGFEKAILVGKFFSEHKQNFPFNFFENAQDTKAYLNQLSLENSTILVKGSRAMKLETVVE